uniref:Histone domain-containing protein n=1 Tax=Trichuris muris TaxID=70415 RepID=A0A5S6QSV2_TRIMR
MGISSHANNTNGASSSKLRAGGILQRLLLNDGPSNGGRAGSQLLPPLRLPGFLTREGGTRKKWKRRLKFPRLADEGPQKKRRRRKGRKYDIGRAMFQAVVLEVIGRLGKQHVRFQCLAIDILQSAAEAHVADVIQDARFVQTLGKRAKNLPKYIALAARLR